LFTGQEFFCLPHAKALLRQAKRVLRRKPFDSLRQDLLVIQRRYLSGLKSDARKFADSYDYRNSDMELGSAKQVLDRAATLM
jgi:hypothetical protein